MIECRIGWWGLRLFIIASLLASFAQAIRCFYCASPGTKIAPQLWLHATEPCEKRRYTMCASPNQACVVVRLTHSRLNFTVAGCSEDRFEGCDQFVQLAPHGPTAIHMCQCFKDRCNSDFHLNFGASLGRIRSNKTLPPETGKLPLLKKVHPINTLKSERDMPCADSQCNRSLSIRIIFDYRLFLFLVWLTQQEFL